MARKKVPEIDMRKAIVSSLSESCDIMSDFSFADILYSVLRQVKPPGIRTSWIRDVSDERIFSVLDGIIAEEYQLRKEKEDGSRRKKE